MAYYRSPYDHHVPRSNVQERAAEKRYHGLRNQGATCYLNSVLQCLYMTEDFREEVEKFVPNQINYDQKRLVQEMQKLFEGMKERVCSTEGITQCLGITKVYEQEDVVEYYQKTLKAIGPQLSKVFEGKMSNKSRCLNDKKHICKEESSFFTIPLAIKAGHNEVFNVVEGLNTFFEPIKLDEDNWLYCKDCGQKTETETWNEIVEFPTILTLYPKRFYFDYYLMRPVKNHCPMKIPPLLTKSNNEYELYAVINHMGSECGGHYNAVIKSFEDDKWYWFDDSSVSLGQMNPPDFNDSINSQKAYLLMYRMKYSEKGGGGQTQQCKETSSAESGGITTSSTKRRRRETSARKRGRVTSSAKKVKYSQKAKQRLKQNKELLKNASNDRHCCKDTKDTFQISQKWRDDVTSSGKPGNRTSSSGERGRRTSREGERGRRATSSCRIATSFGGQGRRAKSGEREYEGTSLSEQERIATSSAEQEWEATFSGEQEHEATSLGEGGCSEREHRASHPDQQRNTWTSSDEHVYGAVFSAERSQTGLDSVTSPIDPSQKASEDLWCGAASSAEEEEEMDGQHHTVKSTYDANDTVQNSQKWCDDVTSSGKQGDRTSNSDERGHRTSPEGERGRRTSPEREQGCRATSSGRIATFFGERGRRAKSGERKYEGTSLSKQGRIATSSAEQEWEAWCETVSSPDEGGFGRHTHAHLNPTTLQPPSSPCYTTQHTFREMDGQHHTVKSTYDTMDTFQNSQKWHDNVTSSGEQGHKPTFSAEQGHRISLSDEREHKATWSEQGLRATSLSEQEWGTTFSGERKHKATSLGDGGCSEREHTAFSDEHGCGAASSAERLQTQVDRVTSSKDLWQNPSEGLCCGAASLSLEEGEEKDGQHSSVKPTNDHQENEMQGTFWGRSQESEIFSANEHKQSESTYNNLSQTMEQGELNKLMCNNCVTQLKGLRQRLETYGSHIISCCGQPADTEPLKAFAQETTEQTNIQADLENKKKDLYKLVKQTEAALAVFQQSNWGHILRSEIDITIKLLDHVYLLYSVYMDKHEKLKTHQTQSFNSTQSPSPKNFSSD